MEKMLYRQRIELFRIVLCLLFYLKDDVLAQIDSSPSNPTSVVLGKEVTFEWNTSVSIKELTWGIRELEFDLIDVPLIYVSDSNNVQFIKDGAGEPGERYKGRISFTGDLAKKRAAFKIIDVQALDAVEYGLQFVETEGDAPIFTSVKLNVVVPANVTQPQVKSHYILGDKVNITCQATGIPLPTVKWSRNEDNKEYPSSIGVTHLVFSSVGKEDDGKYTCMANNSGGNADVTVNVTVYYAPSITEPNESEPTMKINKTGDNKLVCIANGNPSPIFTWKKDGETITKDANMEKVSGGVKSTLTLQSEITTDVEYVCIANNTLGFTNATIKLTFADTDRSTTTTTTGEPGGAGKRSSNDSALIGGAVGGALALILLVVIIVIIVKCRKGRRGSRGYQGRGGYKERGTKSVSDIDDYEPVAKNNELPQYATVDRSKKTPKKPDLNYAELDHRNQSERSVDARPAKRNNEPTTYAEIVQTWEPTNETTYANVPRRGLNSSEML